MRKPTSMLAIAALIAASTSSTALIGATTSADPAPTPADPNAASCAALSKVQPAIDDLRDKVNAYLGNQDQVGEAAQQSPAPTAATAPGSKPSTTASPAPASNAKLENIVDSLRRISGELKSAGPNIKDAPLRNSANTLATTVDSAADSVSSAATSKPGSLNLLQLSSLGINITSAAAFYQINENRVCAGAPVAGPAPSSATPTPAKPTATTSAAPKPSPARAPK